MRKVEDDPGTGLSALWARRYFVSTSLQSLFPDTTPLREAAVHCSTRAREVEQVAGA
jgi:hypothetical protein